MIDALNEYFVPVEYDATAAGAVPSDVPAMWAIKRAWDNSPWTRVSFGSEWVIDPTGEFVLSTGFHKHANLPMVETLESCWETALTRFARVRSHARGSAGEAAEIEKVKAEIVAELDLLRPCWVDFDVGTRETLKVVATEDPTTFHSRLAGVFTFPDPVVRRQSAEALGRWVTSYRTDFSEEHVLFLQRQMFNMLTDEDAEVRHAAAVAMYRFEDLEPPGLQGDELVAGATGLWTEADMLATNPAAATDRSEFH